MLQVSIFILIQNTICPSQYSDTMNFVIRSNAVHVQLFFSQRSALRITPSLGLLRAKTDVLSPPFKQNLVTTTVNRFSDKPLPYRDLNNIIKICSSLLQHLPKLTSSPECQTIIQLLPINVNNFFLNFELKNHTTCCCN